jgi:hypothetical protein
MPRHYFAIAFAAAWLCCIAADIAISMLFSHAIIFFLACRGCHCHAFAIAIADADAFAAADDYAFDFLSLLILF